MNELNKIALSIINNGKGILAADESTATMSKRLESVGVESTPDNRLNFRHKLFSSQSMKTCIGGVILYEETLRQSYQSVKIPEIIKASGALPGIKVDTGAKKLSSSPKEKITEGLDNLRERLEEYFSLGARFTKWRGVYIIDKNFPSKISIYANAHSLARYASLVQECGMVPIVEPEVLMDGDHSAETCLEKTSSVLKKCFDELVLHNVDLAGIILKPNMILPGMNSEQKISNENIAEMTIQCLVESVPKEVPGIAFLSGGQTDLEATKNLNLISKINKSNFIMTFSYGRALQQSALKYWSKNIEDIKNTQKIFNHRAEMCSLASQGKWTEEIEKSK